MNRNSPYILAQQAQWHNPGRWNLYKLMSKKWEHFESSCMKDTVFNGKKSNPIHGAQHQTLVSQASSPLGSGFPSHVSCKGIEKFCWTLTDWSRICDLTAFRGIRIGQSNSACISYVAFLLLQPNCVMLTALTLSMTDIKPAETKCLL